MCDVSQAESGTIFISYRRQQSSHVAGRLYDQLADLFGPDRIFIDIDAIKPGENFAEVIDHAIATTTVLLAIISPHWLTATNEEGYRRLDDLNDIVRLEIEAALTRNVLVVPILVEGAVMPGRRDLPESLASLALCNAFVLRHESFRHDVERLAAEIGGVIRTRSRTEPTSGPAGNKRWKLESVTSSSFEEKFRLSAGAEAHEIIYKVGWVGNKIIVDGKVDAVRFEVNKEHFLGILSSLLGIEVTVRIEHPSLLSPPRMVLRIGSEILMQEFRN